MSRPSLAVVLCSRDHIPRSRWRPSPGAGLEHEAANKNSSDDERVLASQSRSKLERAPACNGYVAERLGLRRDVDAAGSTRTSRRITGGEEAARDGVVAQALAGPSPITAIGTKNIDTRRRPHTNLQRPVAIGGRGRTPPLSYVALGRRTLQVIDTHSLTRMTARSVGRAAGRGARPVSCRSRATAADSAAIARQTWLVSRAAPRDRPASTAAATNVRGGGAAVRIRPGARDPVRITKTSRSCGVSRRRDRDQRAPQIRPDPQRGSRSRARPESRSAPPLGRSSRGEHQYCTPITNSAWHRRPRIPCSRNPRKDLERDNLQRYSAPSAIAFGAPNASDSADRRGEQRPAHPCRAVPRGDMYMARSRSPGSASTTATVSGRSRAGSTGPPAYAQPARRASSNANSALPGPRGAEVDLERIASRRRQMIMTPSRCPGPLSVPRSLSSSIARHGWIMAAEQPGPDAASPFDSCPHLHRVDAREALRSGDYQAPQHDRVLVFQFRRRPRPPYSSMTWTKPCAPRSRRRRRQPAATRPRDLGDHDSARTPCSRDRRRRSTRPAGLFASF